MSRWIVAVTRANHEGIAKRNAERQGNTCYLPRYIDAFSKRTRVLFPSYLFVFLHDERFSHLRGTRGILSLVLSGKEQVATLPEHIIDRLQASEHDGRIVLPKREPFEFNQRVRIRFGALAGQIGLYQGQASRDRVRVLFTLFNRGNECMLERRALIAA